MYTIRRPKLTTNPDNLFHLEFFDDIDNLAEPLWNLQYPKTAPKNNLTHSLEVVLKSYKKSVKHNLDAGRLDHSLSGLRQELIVDGQSAEVLQL